MGALSSVIRTLHYCLAPLRTARASANVKSVYYRDVGYKWIEQSLVRQRTDSSRGELDATEAAKPRKFTIVPESVRGRSTFAFLHKTAVHADRVGCPAGESRDTSIYNPITPDRRK
jgi:hypothetical protein